MNDAADPATLTLRLRAIPPRAAGRALGLHPGDLLVCVNGRPFLGDVAAFERRFADRKGRALALAFRRGDAVFTVLADRPDLGQWDTVPAPAGLSDGERIDPDALRNWEILRSADGQYDLHPLTVPATALVFPPLWMLQMRLWVPFATLCAALVAAGLVTVWAAGIVWLAAGLHMRHAAIAYLRLDRRARGLMPHAVHAARTEAEAHAVHRSQCPADRFLFERGAAPEPAGNA